MNYIEVRLMPTPCTEEVCDVLAALLAPLGFDSFDVEFPSDPAPAPSAPVALKAYVAQNLWDSAALQAMLSDLPLPGVEVAWVATECVMEDWNRQWEESQQFEPIVVGQADAQGVVPCCVHSPATPVGQLPACRHEVIIDPRMSFGSGAHETTSQLLDEILTTASADGPRRALDMGTGTGVLAILCAELGAQVRAIEIDDWVAANAVDNVLLNGQAGRVQVECGDASLLTEGPTYDLVLANINRNVLVADMASYAAVMLPGATLLLSGFYEEDLPIVASAAQSHGLRLEHHRQRSGWVVARFRK